jgi:hypothetical protein
MLYVSMGTFLLVMFLSWVTACEELVSLLKDNNKIFVSVKHNNILLFIVTYWRQVSAVRPSSGHP